MRSSRSSAGAGWVSSTRAQDTRLKRQVAIKLLPPDLTRDETAKQRFLQEAQAASALDHPNICVIHEIDETPEGQLYLAMAYYEGETLKEKIERGPLPLDEAVDIAVQVGQGLAKAHEAKITHRDIKPANLMLTGDGMVKILDFGLAKLAGAEGITQTGTTLGTVAYMSPEQLRGQEVDQRADIWSLGVVLFELVAGERPFKGEQLQAVSVGILQGQPAPLTGSRTGVPLELERVVNRALAKPVADRYQTVADLLSELRTVTRALDSGATAAAGAEKSVPSIAVLPFSDMSPQKDQDYFCEGMAEELINGLSGVEGLRVAARASAFQLKGEPIRKIGELLNVKTVLDGSVRTAGTRLRVTVQLIEAASGYQIWSKRYDRDTGDVFAIQDEISEGIVEALQDSLVDTTKKQGGQPRRSTDSLDAYQMFLKGRHNWYKRETGSLQRAARFFEQAAALDPHFAQAHVGIALTFTSLAIYGMEPGLARQTSLPALERARALTPDLPELWAATAYEAMFLGWEWQTAEQALDRALAGNRHAPEFHCWRGFLLGHLGRFDAAIAVARTAVELDPLSGYARGVLGYLLTGAERDDEAVAVLEEAREMDADFIFTQFLLGIAYAAAGRHEQGATVLERATAQSGRSSFYLGLLGWTYGLADRREDAERLLEELAARRIAGYVPPFCDAWVHCGLGNTDRAFEWLDRSVAAHAFLQPLFPTYRAIGDDPRFDNIKKRMGLA